MIYFNDGEQSHDTHSLFIQIVFLGRLIDELVFREIRCDLSQLIQLVLYLVFVSYLLYLYVILFVCLFVYFWVPGIQ